MVVLANIQSSNARIATSLPEGMVALFVGATSGIGEATLKQFAKHAARPRVYFVGRKQEAANRIIAECETLNPEGTYIFISADVSLLSNVDEVCRDIKDKERALNLLVLTPGVATIHNETPEGLRKITSLLYFARMRFIVNLLPLLQQATSLRRVITVGAAGSEGPIDTTDFEGRKLSAPLFRGHITSLTTVALEELAEKAPTVSFINTHPGAVQTGITREVDNLRMWIVWLALLLFGRWICIPAKESGERHLFVATSARYPARDGDDGVSLSEGVMVARGVDGEVGGGVYSVTSNGESSNDAINVLKGFREMGIGEIVWRYTESQFKRITGVGAA
ncbi:short-chain dehydrogenases/reductase [Aspergillus vadensis CBS 113365]|uniref:Short-chain dehydrogenases/reductase n=1 Tax=Aspergillus vadensis (strain CBS 113365 / IMI 142717 / IBT 24658) TaxID=1448311 RepID=A0A319BBW8_ASPVC|nr:short-chain dehydrogenases/reductase [Aspergillus vadensis CBS 113365]PYH69501.1 short-chain dehydrogenases/reductase [Aspergillus vadensis CBS 113365]